MEETKTKKGSKFLVMLFIVICALLMSMSTAFLADSSNKADGEQYNAGIVNEIDGL